MRTEKLYNFLSKRKKELVKSYAIAKKHVLFTEYSGRKKIEELSKTEKTMLGTVFETVVKKELNIREGQALDCSLDDFEFDIKFTCRNNWMIPPECIGQTCLLAQGTDDTLKVGVFIASEDNLNTGQNRDKKRTVSKKGKGTISWVPIVYNTPVAQLVEQAAHNRPVVGSSPTGSTYVETEEKAC